MRSRPFPTPGDLDQRVKLLGARRDLPASDGGTTESYPLIAEVWGMVEGVSGSLYFAGEQTEKSVTHTVTVRGRPDWQSVQYLDWRGRRFLVRRVADLDPNLRFQEYHAEEMKSGV